MVRPINTDTFLLRRKSTPATTQDLPVAQDLLDTLSANLDRCVGMAANMIGVSKRIIVVVVDGAPMVLLNPVAERKSGKPYEAQEGCLSLPGTRPATRYPSITVAYQDLTLKPRRRTFTGFAAQIVQHEMDHLEGILI